MERLNLIKDITDFSAKSGMAPSTICLRAVGNGRLFNRLVDGGSCSITTAEKLRAWMADWIAANPHRIRVPA